MPSLKVLATVLLASTACAMPSSLDDTLLTRANTVTCSVAQKDTKKPPLKLTFDLDVAKSIAKQAPAGNINQNKGQGTTASGYPHTFQNEDRLAWARTECQYNAKKKATTVETLEFPIYDGKNTATLFPWTESKKANAVPPCRVVYARVGGAFCGVMCHKSEDGEKVKGFNMCT